MDDDALLENREKLHPEIGHWWCSKCGNYSYTDDNLRTMYTDPCISKNLFQMDKETKARIERNLRFERGTETPIDIAQVRVEKES